uniref:Protein DETOXIFICATION n=1 Tax=Oryza barthii TaxID=65489 RepID=A0A0D3H929_9ORYZ
MASRHSDEATQCHQQLLVMPAATASYPKLHDRPRLAGAAAGVLGEVASILCLAGPMVGAGILLYLRSLVSMVFLGRLGQLPLAGGSLALGFANITGYSVLSGLAGGMDPVCGQAFGAGRTDLLRAALRRTVVLLLAASVPISALWVAMHRVLTTSLIYIFPHSLGCAVSTRVGHELGAGRPERARLVARVGVGLGAALGIVAFGFAVSVRAAWARMTPSVRLAAAALPLLGAAELGNCPQTAGCGVLRGSARPERAARINVAAFYGVGMPVALALAFWPAGLDFRGMWGGMLAAQLVCAWLMLRAVLGTDWAEQAERARELTGGGDGYAAVAAVIVDDDKAKQHAEMDKPQQVDNTLLMAIDCV